MASAPIERVAVAGGGITAWSAAAALKRHIPSLDVTVVSCPVPDDALADRMIGTLPSIGGFHGDLGLSESDTVVRAQSGLRVGTVFDGWSAGRRPYVHAYGSYGAPHEAIPFHQLWLRARGAEGLSAFDEFSAAALLGKRRRISGRPEGPAPTVGYGLHLTLERYHKLVRDFALHLRVSERPCRSFQVKLAGGFVETLMLDEGGVVGADLFVDCTGPSALLRRSLEGRFHDWSRWIPCDRLAFSTGEPEPDTPLLDRVTAAPAGWRWLASSPARSSSGIAFSSTHSSGEQDASSLAGDPVEITIRQGRWSKPWVRNCVAIGDAAVMVEPLEWTNLHLAHSQIDRVIEMMPGRDCADVELHEYNRQCGDEADRVRDFICMHYVTARRDEPFWKDAAGIEPPDSLAHTLALFAERGRLPYYEEETFSRDSWLAVLLGQGFEPRRIDPLANLLTYEEARAELARYADFVRSFVDAQPGHDDFMSTLRGRSR